SRRRRRCRPRPAPPCRRRWPGHVPRRSRRRAARQRARVPGWPRPGPPAPRPGRTPAPAGAIRWHASGRLLLQPQELGQQLLMGFGVRRVGIDALDRADDHALGLVEVPHALGAQRGVDHVDGLALGDGAIRARGLADVAVDAELADAQGHGAIVDPARAARRRRAAGGGGVEAYLASTNTKSTPAGATAADTRSWSAASPMNSTRTPFMVSGSTLAKASTTMSAILLESDEA